MPPWAWIASSVSSKLIPAGIRFSMNRPITSPWFLVLTSSPTITLMPFGLRPRLERAGDLVVVGHRDRAEASGPRLGEENLDRGRAVMRVVGVHVQVDVDQRPVGEAGRDLRLGPRVVAAGDERDAAPFDLVDQAVRAELCPERLCSGDELLPALWPLDQRLELGREGLRVSGGEAGPECTVGEQLLVHRQA